MDYSTTIRGQVLIMDKTIVGCVLAPVCVLAPAVGEVFLETKTLEDDEGVKFDAVDTEQTSLEGGSICVIAVNGSTKDIETEVIYPIPANVTKDVEVRVRTPPLLDHHRYSISPTSSMSSSLGSGLTDTRRCESPAALSDTEQTSVEGGSGCAVPVDEIQVHRLPLRTQNSYSVSPTSSLSSSLGSGSSAEPAAKTPRRRSSSRKVALLELMSGIRRVLSRSRNREKKTPAKSRSLPRSAAAPVVALAAETDATSQNRAASLPRPRASRPQVLPRQSTSAAVKDDDASESTHRSTPPLPPLPSRHTSTPTIQRSHSHQPTSTQTLRQKYGRPSTLLGKGANGNCYLVRRDSDSRVFAVKQFRRRKEDESPRAYLKKLTNEYCIGTLLHHPNVVQTLDIIFEEKGQAYEIMELCQGGDLYEAIASRPMTADEANCIFAQLIQGVAYLHSLGVCHRDLKPENCLFDTGNKLKIIDFGSADVVKNPFGNVVRKSTGKCGSGPYMAPEEFTATEYDGRKVDVWACGIIYLAMVFRRFPWAAAIQTDTHFASYLRHDGRNRFLDTLPEAPKRVVSRMLDPNPETRFTIEECLADEWIQEIIICRGCVTRHTHGRSRKL